MIFNVFNKHPHVTNTSICTYVDSYEEFKFKPYSTRGMNEYYRMNIAGAWHSRDWQQTQPRLQSIDTHTHISANATMSIYLTEYLHFFYIYFYFRKYVDLFKHSFSCNLCKIKSGSEVFTIKIYLWTYIYIYINVYICIFKKDKMKPFLIIGSSAFHACATTSKHTTYIYTYPQIVWAGIDSCTCPSSWHALVVNSMLARLF